MRRHRLLLLLVLAIGLAALSSCSTIGYYSQAVGGHLKLMRAREPIEKLLANEDTDPELRVKLQTLVDARQFAVDSLQLPENDSYSSYAATGRQYVTWNVVAAPEFSLQPHTWCFPVAGCVSYRGYFAESDAQDYAATLAAKNFDVNVGGASAYSTLGWFDDPVLDTMLRGGDVNYISTLFHELAHQVLYVKDDSNFNEAFATFVEQQGIRIWLASRDESERIGRYDTYLSRNADFSELLKITRQNLQSLYQQQLDDVTMRQRKQVLFDDMQTAYSALKERWDGYAGYDGWFAREVNNARLLSVATYRRLVPAFAGLFKEAGEEMPAFYELAKTVAALPAEQRQQRLQRYLDKAAEQ